MGIVIDNAKNADNASKVNLVQEKKSVDTKKSSKSGKVGSGAANANELKKISADIDKGAFVSFFSTVGRIYDAIPFKKWIAGYGIYKLGVQNGRREGRKEAQVVYVPALDAIQKMLENKPKKWTHTRKYYFIKLVDGLKSYDKKKTSEEDAERLVRYAILAFFPKDEKQALTFAGLLGTPIEKFAQAAEDATQDVMNNLDKNLDADKVNPFGFKGFGLGFLHFLERCGTRALSFVGKKVVAPVVNTAALNVGYLGANTADWFTNFNDEMFLENKGEFLWAKVENIKWAADKLTFGYFKNGINKLPDFNVANKATKPLVEQAAKDFVPLLADAVQKFGDKAAEKARSEKVYSPRGDLDEAPYKNINIENSVKEKGVDDLLGLNDLNIPGLAKFIYWTLIYSIGDKVCNSILPERLRKTEATTGNNVVKDGDKEFDKISKNSSNASTKNNSVDVGEENFKDEFGKKFGKLEENKEILLVDNKKIDVEKDSIIKKDEKPVEKKKESQYKDWTDEIEDIDFNLIF
jgi:hypothetical protein